MSAVRAAGRQAFSSLKVRNFRLYITAQLISVSGTWMQSVAQAWLILHLTDSGVALGALVGLQFLPMLLLGPVVAWRWRRHRTAEAAVVAVMAWTTAFVFAISSLVEIGENERFRSELGPLPLITATVVLAALWRRWRQPTDVGEGRSESEAPDDALSGASSPNSMASGEGTSGDGPSVANVS